MGVPSDLLLYCGLCILIVVIFCCCFQVTELLKVRYLRKLTSPHRYSLGGVSSSELVDNGSRSSTRRHTTIEPTTYSPICSNGGDGGNFAVITVFTYDPKLQPSQDHERQPRHTANQSRNDFMQQALMPRANPRENSTLFLEENKDYDDTSQNNLIDEPPNYEALFPKM